MAEFRKLPTQQELQQLLYMQGLKPQSTQEILQQNLAHQTIAPIPQNVFQKIAGGAKTAGEMVNRVGTAADVAKLFPGYTGQTQVNIPTGFNFAPKQDPAGGVIPQGLQTQQVNVGQLLQAIKPADVLGISGAERAYGDIGMGRAPKPMDVVDTLALGAGGIAAGKAAVKGVQATKGLPVGMSIQDVGGLLKEAPRSPLGFYSALEDTALNLQRNKGTGQAFLNDLQKGANVKAEEIKWTGLDEFLKDKPNVTKQEVQDYLANNRVDVQEVRSTVPRLPGEEMPGDKGEFLPKFGQYTLPGGENYREILLTLPENFGAKPNKDGYTPLSAITDAQYQSSHFPNQPNILAHLRVNDRVDADGKKMLLIEEVQSDWHQAGREKGYKTKENLENWYNQNKLDEDPPFSELNSEQRRIIEQNRNAGMGGDTGVPDAPFKDSWYQLALKRAIQYAAENGYERIGLTTGKQQADRFDLSKQLSGVSYNPEFKRIAGFDKSGKPVVYQSDVEPDQIANYIGKEAAKKLLEQPLQNKEYALNGIDLQVGGEGMKKYYDEIYPKFLDKYGKKWNARVGETKVKTSVEGDDMFEVVLPNGKVIKTTANKKSADATAASFDGAIVRDINFNEPIRYLDVTPEMKASVSKGQPLFQAIPAIPAAGLLAPQEERK